MQLIRNIKVGLISIFSSWKSLNYGVLIVVFSRVLVVVVGLKCVVLCVVLEL